MLALLKRLLGHITPAGRGLILIAILGWVVVHFTGLDEVRVLVAMAVVCLVVALLLTLLPDRVRASLELHPARTSVGADSNGVLAVTNRGRLPMWSPVVDLPVPGARSTLRLPVLRPRQEHRHEFTIPAKVRGVHQIGPVTSRHHDPLGLLRRDVSWATAADWFVRPRLIPVESFGMGAVADLEGVPSDQISMSDLSFHALREYVRGDDLRHVHWRSSAKADTLLVRQYHDSRRSHITVVVDSDSSAYADPEDFELALSTAASVLVRAAAEDFDLTFLCGALEVDREPVDEVLDATCRAALGAADVREVVVRAARLAPETSLLLLCTGSDRPDVEVRTAIGTFGNDVRRVALRARHDDPTSLRTVDGILLGVLGDLEQLPQLVAQMGAAR